MGHWSDERRKVAHAPQPAVWNAVPDHSQRRAIRGRSGIRPIDLCHLLVGGHESVNMLLGELDLLHVPRSDRAGIKQSKTEKRREQSVALRLWQHTRTDGKVSRSKEAAKADVSAQDRKGSSHDPRVDVESASSKDVS
jgi:hypothetical protein